MDLNLFDRNKKDNNFVSEFIKDLKNTLKNNKKQEDIEENNVLEEYNLYERRKIFLDNKSWKGNDLAWIMDEESVYLSEHGDGGPYNISDINLHIQKYIDTNKLT